MIKSNAIIPDLKAVKDATYFEIIRALTRTARDAAQKIKADLPNKFILRRNWVTKGIRFDAASKSNPVARVYSVDSFMSKQEEGESYSPSGRNVAIPVDVRPNDRAPIPSGMFPRRLLSRSDVFKGDLPGIGVGIFQRRKEGIRILYLLRGSKSTQARWEFAEAANHVVEARFERNLI